MELDDGIRSVSGVVCCRREIGEGKLRLTLDDVVNKDKSTIGHWKHYSLFTWKDFDEQEMLNLKVSENKLAEFGFNVFVRLLAQREHPITE
jgi:hypothetical protein